MRIWIPVVVWAAVLGERQADACTCAPGVVLSPSEGERTARNPVLLVSTTFGEPPMATVLLDAAGAAVPIEISPRAQPGGKATLFVGRPVAVLDADAPYLLRVTFVQGSTTEVSFHTGDGVDETAPSGPGALEAASFGIVLDGGFLCGDTDPRNPDHDVLALAYPPADADVRLSLIDLRRPGAALPFAQLRIAEPNLGDARFVSGGLCGPFLPPLVDGETVCVTLAHWDGSGNVSAPRERCVTKTRECTVDERDQLVCPWPEVAATTPSGGCQVTPGEPTTSRFPAILLLLVSALGWMIRSRA